MGKFTQVPNQSCKIEVSIKLTQSCFQTLDAVFPKDIFSDYLEITTAVVVPCGGPKNYPRTSIKRCYFYIFWSFGTVGFNTFLRAE